MQFLLERKNDDMRNNNRDTNKKNLPMQVLDCTIRDGGYVNNWKFDDILVREVYRSCSKAGVDIVEIGFRGNEKYYDKQKFGRWNFSYDDDIRKVTQGIDGPKIAVMGNYGKIDLEDFDEKKNSLVDIVRIATHKDEIFSAIDFLSKIKLKGYMVSLQAMAYGTYTESEKKELICRLKDFDLDYLYIADSYGSLLPDQIKDILGPFLNLGNIKVGFHAHNSLQMAFANTLEAIRCGAHIVDCSFYGIGRGAGNLPTEILISYLENKNHNKYNVIPILSTIDEFFIALHKEKEWGYQLSYMLSGVFQVHPNFAKKLIEFRDYSIEEMWKVLAYIKKLNPVGYSDGLLNDIINEGFIRRLNAQDRILISNDVNIQEDINVKEEYSAKIQIPYADRHTSRDFLILATGPTLTAYRDKIEDFIEEYNPVILGANYIGGLFKPQYHAFNNLKRFIKFVDTVDSESKLLIGQDIKESVIKEYVNRDYETLYYKDIINANFGIKDNIIQTNCRTISILLLGIAIVMGAKRLFSVGMDGYLGFDSRSSFHFYDDQEDKIMDRKFFFDRHHQCQNFLEQIDKYLTDKGREGIIILTPTSYKKFYKGIENYI